MPARAMCGTLSGRVGILVGAMDIAKGSAAVLIAKAIGAGPTAQLLAGPLAIVGHWFPIYTRFRGGKGLATAYGVLLGWMPVPTLISMSVFAAAQMVIRNMDRGVVAGAATAIFLPPAFGYSWAMVLYALLMFLMLWARSAQDRAHEQRVWASSGWAGVQRHDCYGASEARGQPESGPSEAAAGD